MAIRWPRLLGFLNKRSRPADSDYWYMPYGATQATSAGIRVDEESAVKYLAVYDCVSLISGDVSNLPLLLYRRLPGGGKERAVNHPKYDLCHTAVNDEITSRSWVESGVTHNLLWGNHYSLKIFNKTGKLIQLWPIANPGSIEVSRKKDGFLHYEWSLKDGTKIDKTRAEIFHVPGWGFDGIIGLSPISIAREAIGLGLATEEFGERFFSNGTHPSGLLTMPVEAEGMDDKEQKAYAANFKAQHGSLGKSHSTLIMFNGEKYTPLTMPLNDAQFLESRQFQKLEIAGMYHVPPHKIAIHGANSNYNNEEQENRHYVDSCLMSWLRRWETCLNQQILTQKERLDGYFYEFLVDGLLRGDSAARVAYYTGMVQSGAMTRNEVRSKENMNPLPKEQRADETILPLNFVFAKDADKVPDNGMGNDNSEENMRDWAKKEVRSAEKRSIIARDRIARNYRPLLREAAQQVVNRETKAVKAQIKKLQGQRAGSDMDAWMDEFYQDMADYIRQKLGPTMESYARAIADAAIDEIGVKDLDLAELDSFIRDYISTYTIRHVASSQGQIKSIKTDESFDDLDTRMDEWHEKRADKIADNETVRLSNGAFQTVAFLAGLKTVLRNRGPKTCPYCQSLEGTVVGRGQYLVKDGDEITPKGHEPMKINGSKAHVPVHQGCDCYMAIF